MRFASVAEIKDGLSEYLARAKEKNEPSSSLITASPTHSSSRSRQGTWRSWSGGSLRGRSSPAPGKPKRMPSTTTYKRGQVVVVNVPFTGQTGSKPRPALVASVDAFHRKLLAVIVCPISSQPRYYQEPGSGDYPLKHWKAVGLHHPSTARISNILAVEKKLITLHAEDLARVEQGLRKAFGL
jgi:mRNA-degrading endonuclease toxin of MazEF toxin-antitoxin module